MTQFIFGPSKQQARKIYQCDACWCWINSGWSKDELTADQRLIVEAAEADGWKIIPNCLYSRGLYKDGSRLIVYRARADMENLVTDLDLWMDD